MGKKGSRQATNITPPEVELVTLATLKQSDILPATKAQISLLMAELGRKGGKKGGKRRLETMTATERSQIARKAALARWKKEAE